MTHNTNCHAECLFAECRYAECRGANQMTTQKNPAVPWAKIERQRQKGTNEAVS